MNYLVVAPGGSQPWKWDRLSCCCHKVASSGESSRQWGGFLTIPSTIAEFIVRCVSLIYSLLTIYTWSLCTTEFEVITYVMHAKNIVRYGKIIWNSLKYILKHWNLCPHTHANYIPCMQGVLSLHCFMQYEGSTSWNILKHAVYIAKYWEPGFWTVEQEGQWCPWTLDNKVSWPYLGDITAHLLRSVDTF